MGTRADFYVGRGERAEWLGSIGWDGYPEGIDATLLAAETEAEYRRLVTEFLAREDGTQPEHGWPWPWNDSNTTDYAYAFDGGKVHAFYHGWFDPLAKEPGDKADTAVIFPDMSARKNVTLGPRSGLIFGLGLK